MVISTLTIHPVFAQKDAVAKTPPMGWNSWNNFARAINEDLIKDIADAMVNSGMKDAGYEYVVIDDLWQKGRVSGDSVIIQIIYSWKRLFLQKLDSRDNCLFKV